MTRRALALTILVCLLLLAWAIVVEPILALAGDRRIDIANLTDQLGRLTAIGARRPALDLRARHAVDQLADRQMLWSGANRTAITSRMLDVLRAAAAQDAGQITSSSELETRPEEGFERLGVRLRVEGSITAMVALLAAVENARPALFVDSLALTSGEVVSHDRPPQLGIEMSVVGYRPVAP